MLYLKEKLESSINYQSDGEYYKNIENRWIGQNIEIFKEHFANLISDKFYNANVSQLNVSRKNNYKEFYIVDANGNTFIFNEYSIMNYKVMFDLTTI